LHISESPNRSGKPGEVSSPPFLKDCLGFGEESDKKKSPNHYAALVAREGDVFECQFDSVHCGELEVWEIKCFEILSEGNFSKIKDSSKLNFPLEFQRRDP
jgi:hypothetical protein